MYVNANTHAGGNDDGSSWDNAYRNLQDALAQAAALRSTAEQPTVEIWVAQGVYKPVVPSNLTNVTDDERNATFELRNGVALYGGF
ncbi:hypothetical protein E9531_12565, partial [Lampropedia puyangensis]